MSGILDLYDIGTDLKPVTDTTILQSGQQFKIIVIGSNWFQSDSSMLDALNQYADGIQFTSVDTSFGDGRAFVWGTVLQGNQIVVYNLKQAVLTGLNSLFGVYGLSITEVDAASSSYSFKFIIILVVIAIVLLSLNNILKDI